MNLAQIDAAIEKQRAFVRKKQAELESARSRDINNSTSVQAQITNGLLTQNVLDAQIVLRKLEKIRAQETPVDQRATEGGGAAFWGAEH
jgi:hypothetical protein